MTTVLEDLARGIDTACEAQDAPALRGYLESIASLSRAGVSKVERGSLAFFEANIHAALRNHADSTSADWLEPLLEAEIRALRVARLTLADESTRTLRNDLKLRVITNLANALNRSGRFVEAIELWDEVLAEHPRFGMAMGNKALALYGYARYAGTGIERALLLRASYRTVKAAMEAGVESHASAQISDLAAHISSVADWEKAEVPLPVFDAGRSKRERQYRRWCVRHRTSTSKDLSLRAFWWRKTTSGKAVNPAWIAVFPHFASSTFSVLLSLGTASGFFGVVAMMGSPSGCRSFAPAAPDWNS